MHCRRNIIRLLLITIVVTIRVYYLVPKLIHVVNNPCHFHILNFTFGVNYTFHLQYIV